MGARGSGRGGYCLASFSSTSASSSSTSSGSSLPARKAQSLQCLHAGPAARSTFERRISSAPAVGARRAERVGVLSVGQALRR